MLRWHFLLCLEWIIQVLREPLVQWEQQTLWSELLVDFPGFVAASLWIPLLLMSHVCLIWRDSGCIVLWVQDPLWACFVHNDRVL